MYGLTFVSPIPSQVVQGVAVLEQGFTLPVHAIFICGVLKVSDYILISWVL